MQICVRQYYETGMLCFSAYEGFFVKTFFCGGTQEYRAESFAQIPLAPCASLAQQFSARDACTQAESPRPFLEIIKDHL